MVERIKANGKRGVGAGGGKGGGQGEIEGGEVTDGWAQTGNDIYDFAGQCGFY